MKPWNIIGWFIVAIIVLALLGGIGYSIYKGVCLLIEYLPSGINWWVGQPAWLKWWIIPSLLMAWLFVALRGLSWVIDDINEMIR